MKIHFLALIAVGIVSAAEAAILPLSQLDLSRASEMYFSPPPKLSAGNHPIKIAGRKFADGFGEWGSSSLRVSLDGQAEVLTAWIGLTDDTKEPGPVWFEVIGDGRMLWTGDPMRKGDAAMQINVPLRGVRNLILAVQSPDELQPYSAWADAAIAYSGAVPVVAAPPAETPVTLTPKPGLSPRLTGAASVGARPGHPFLFTVSATGQRPLTFTATDLPSGLSLDAATGQITGSVAQAGEHLVGITARNARGSASRPLRIVIGDTLALTPPMGWNSWNGLGDAVTEEDVKAAADAFVKTGLIDHGWSYVDIDDFWMTRPLADDPVVKMLDARSRARRGSGFKFPPNPDPLLVGPARDSAGRINANRRFPDMPGLTAYLHHLGLKAGIYSSPGPLTCGRCTGSYAHEALDAQRFSDWGFDLLKYDWCSYVLFAQDESQAEWAKPGRVMGDALRAQSRDIVFSLSNDGKGDAWTWGASTGGNTWRTTDDIRDSWGSVAGIGFSQNGHEAFAGPGRWNDADMLVVGLVGGWSRSPHATHLTPDEQYTHLALWSLLSSPLMIGCDLTRLDDFTLGLLTNDEVLAIDQDSLSRPAHRVLRQRDLEVWARTLSDGSLAVGLFNRGEIPARITAPWSELGLAGPRTVRDLWRQRDLGQFTEAFSASVPPHGVVLVKLARP